MGKPEIEQHRLVPRRQLPQRLDVEAAAKRSDLLRERCPSQGNLFPHGPFAGHCEDVAFILAGRMQQQGFIIV